MLINYFQAQIRSIQNRIEQTPDFFPDHFRCNFELDFDRRESALNVVQILRHKLFSKLILIL